MPVLLTTPEEWAAWLEAPIGEALELQRSLPDGEMREVSGKTRTKLGCKT